MNGGTQLTALRILVVEDDPVICLLLAELLIDLGHHVCGTVGTEQDAIAAAARDVPDLMLVDMGLAGGNGLSTMQTIQQHLIVPHIFMTGATRSEIPPHVAVLRKPFFEQDLARAIEHAMDRSASSAMPAHGPGMPQVEAG